MPQPTPPPPPRTTPEPPWTQPHPSIGNPGLGTWLGGYISGVLRNGPTFGPRAQEYLPYLVVRAAANDRGARPLPGVFWESPDIYVLPNVDAAAAPLAPPTLGGVAVANAPTTLYAHVWNLGKAPAYRIRVEFYWFNPSLGITFADRNIIGAAWINLENRFTLYDDWREQTESGNVYLSRGSHAIVRCPTTWVPTYENAGHECLVVRAFEPILDSVALTQFSAARDRHVAQRNIAVVVSSSPAAIDLPLSLGYPEAPATVQVEVAAHAPGSMEWLQLYANSRTPGFHAPPAGTVTAGVLPPTVPGVMPMRLAEMPQECRSFLLRMRERFERGCEPLRVSLHASAKDLAAGEAQVVRVTQRVESDVIGGYSVVLLGR